MADIQQYTWFGPNRDVVFWKTAVSVLPERWNELGFDSGVVAHEVGYVDLGPGCLWVAGYDRKLTPDDKDVLFSDLDNAWRLPDPSTSPRFLSALGPLAVLIERTDRRTRLTTTGAWAVCDQCGPPVGAGCAPLGPSNA